MFASKNEFCNRLGDDWQARADALEIQQHEHSKFARGDEGRAVWDWLERRGRLGELPVALRGINRGDLADVLEEKPHESFRASSVDRAEQWSEPGPLKLRVFLSSPGDVTDERALAREVIERLENERAHRDKLRLEVVAWDKPGVSTAMPAHLEPQEALERGLWKPSSCDIVIVIFGYRMGTRLSEKHRKPNGEPYWSGTEYEALSTC